ncbi:DinB family protein [Domibacillus epiphyticus]|uniref:DinB-like domain-containing protein n=1 Tax=Domibacillus epiphyticus TaxID=1714355 RepID=A0A1V2A736_9BACI|nr:DinB family protein [Domibacillus epiphyticus]OMP66757.1 hypothetical protein BTO28_10680 [Domibacillus epiphyticus]
MESIKQFLFSRSFTVDTLQNVPVEKWDEQPSGCPNSIRWNAGHIYFSTEALLNMADESYKVERPEWGVLFATGTRPSEWTGDVTEAAAILQALKQQGARIEAHFAGKLTAAASIPLNIRGHEMENAEAILQFVTWHEGSHAGMIKTISNVLK